MNSETFKSRKKFLDEFYKERVEFTYSEDESIEREIFISNEKINITENVFRTDYFNPEVYTFDFIIEKVKPFYCYLLSYHEKYFNNCNSSKFKLKTCLTDYGEDYTEITSCDFYNPYFNYYLEGVDSFNESIKLIKVSGFFTIPLTPFFFEVYIEEDRKIKEVIKIQKSFKTDECVICLSNPPSNCGHIAICTECDKLKSIKTCPVCKTENTILRLIE